MSIALLPFTCSPSRVMFRTVTFDRNRCARSTKRITGRACNPSPFGTVTSRTASVSEADNRALPFLADQSNQWNQIRRTTLIILQPVRFLDEFHDFLMRTRLPQKAAKLFPLQAPENLLHRRHMVVNRVLRA